MGHVDISGVEYGLPDGRPLLRDVNLRIGEGSKTALIGPNGTGKTTLIRIIAGDLKADDGAVVRSGGLGIMRQFIGQLRDESTVRDLLLMAAADPIRKAAAEIDRTELLMMERDEEADQMAYAQALVDWGDVGGYDIETLWDECTMPALGMPFEQAQWRKVTTLSGGEQKRLVLEALLRGPEDVLILDEPTQGIDIAAKVAVYNLINQLTAAGRAVILISSDHNELIAMSDRIAIVRDGSIVEVRDAKDVDHTHLVQASADEADMIHA